MANVRKIVSIHPGGVAKVFTWVYGILGIVSCIEFWFIRSPEIVLPFGFVLAPTYLTFNLHIPFSTEPILRILTLFAFELSLIVTGHITGRVLAFCLNFAAKRTGGIEAEFLEVTTSDESENASKDEDTLEI